MERKEYEIVRAKKFEVVDETGRLRVAVGPGDENGSVGFQFYSSEGEPKMTLSVDSSGSAQLWMRDKTNEITAAIFTEAEGGPFIGLSNLGENVEDSWGIGLQGLSSGAEKSHPTVNLATRGNPQILLTIIEGVPYFIMHDEKGNEVWKQVGLPDD